MFAYVCVCLRAVSFARVCVCCVCLFVFLYCLFAYGSV